MTTNPAGGSSPARGCLIAAGVVAVLIVGGCVVSTSLSGDVTPDDRPGGYEQTWATPYSRTTCADWTSRMTDLQKDVAAADMLAAAQKNDGTPVAAPGSGLIPGPVRRFSAAVTAACTPDTALIVDVGLSVYRSDPQYAP